MRRGESVKFTVNKKTGEAHRSGVSFGAKAPVIHSMDQGKNQCVLKVPGATSWSGQGQQSYYSTYLIVLDDIEVTQTETSFTIAGVVAADHIPVRSTKDGVRSIEQWLSWRNR